MPKISVDDWWKYLEQTVPRVRTDKSFDIPDAAYEALRERFYSEVMSPRLAKQGLSPEGHREDFYKATVRPGKSSTPLLDVGIAGAASGFMSPMGVINPKLKRSIAEAKSNAEREAQRQGHGDLSIGASSMVGEGVGMAPYFTGPVAAAQRTGTALASKFAAKRLGEVASRAAGEVAAEGSSAAMAAGQTAWDAALAVARKPFATAVEIPTVGAVQGMYDAVRAEEGHRMVEGFTGFGIGAGAVGVFAGVASLPAALRKLHGLNRAQAEAVVSTAQGMATEQQEVIANTLINKMPELGTTIESWLTENTLRAKKLGMPAEALEIEKGQFLHIRMRGADGKEYALNRLDPAKIDKLVDRINGHLEKGGEIISVKGPQGALTNLYRQFETQARGRGDFDLPVVVRGADPQAGPLVLYKGPPGTIEAEAFKPVAPAQAGPPRNQAILESLVNDDTASPDLREAARKRLEALREPTPQAPAGVEPPSLTTSGADLSSPPVPPAGPTNKIGVESLNPLDFVETLPDGSFRDTRNGAHYFSMEAFMRANKIKMEVKPGFDEAGGAWFSPTGKDARLEPGQIHSDWAAQMLKSEGRQPGLDPTQTLLEEGWVRQRGSKIEVTWDVINSDSFSRALMQAVEDTRRIGRNNVVINSFPKGEVAIDVNNKDMVAAMMMNPRKTFLELSAGRKPGLMFEKRSVFAPTEEPDALARPFSVDVKERPTQFRGMVTPEIQEASGGVYGISQGMGKGQKPIILYADEMDNVRRTVFHENIHGHLAYLGIDELVTNLVPKVPGASTLLNAFSPGAAQAAGPYLGEELVTTLSAAVRTHDAKILDAFVRADESLQEVYKVAYNIAEVVKHNASLQPDSLHQRQLISKMTDLQRRVSGMIELKRDVELAGHKLYVSEGRLAISDGTTTKYFDDRRKAVEYIENMYREPINAPNLVDESAVLTGMPKFEMKSPIQDPPLTTDPTGIGLPPGGSVKGGAQAISFYFRPFYSWLQTVANKNNWPELYGTFKVLDDKVSDMDGFVKRYEHQMYDIFKAHAPARRHDLYQYLEASDANKPKIVQMLNLTKDEIATTTRVRKQILDPLFKEFGIDPDLYVQDYAPRIRENPHMAPDAIKPSGRLTKSDIDFFAEHVRTGELDPRDTDLLRTVHTYLRIGARKKFLGPDLEAAAKVVNAKNEDGSFVMGTLQPLFKRHLDYIQGRPDFTQRVVDGAMQSGIDIINETIESANAKLPSALKMPMITADARDALGRFTLFSYAGTLGMRPMTWIRDSLQVLLTTYPMLGGKYFNVGLNKAFGVRKGGKGSDAWQIAEQYGATMSHSDLQNLYSGNYESLATGTTARISEAMLRPLQWANNSNRLVSFWGHSEMALDAIKQFKTNPMKLQKASGLMYLDKELREKFVQEIASADPSQWRDISFRIGKEMTDISQWNYKRGAHPGIYKYAMGRLLGQYGTWPMNYVQYLRRIAGSGDRLDRVGTMTRWAAAHYAVLKVGENLGIDTGSWVFTAPMAYQGSPIFTAALAAPQALGDTQSRMGDEARRRVYEYPQVNIPGGLAARQVYRGIVNDEPELWKIMLGFDPLDDREMKEGVHNLP